MKSASPTGSKKIQEKGRFAGPFAFSIRANPAIMSMPGKVERFLTGPFPKAPFFRPDFPPGACYGVPKQLKDEPRMRVTKSAQLLALTLSLALGTTAFAQDSATPAPAVDAPVADAPVADGLSMGTESGAPTTPAEGGVGSTYTEANFGTWEQRCVRTEDGADPCQLYHLLKDSDGNNVAEISIFGLPAGQQAAAGATVIVPLETLLTADLEMAIDGAKARQYPFSWCSNIGCVARIGFTAAEVAGFKKGNVAKLTIVPVVAPDQKVELTVSLSGFTAGYDAVNVANNK
jgi:invasion protein IalB